MLQKGCNMNRVVSAFPVFCGKWSLMEISLPFQGLGHK